MQHIRLEFEKPIVALENKIDELRHFSMGENLDMQTEITHLERKLEKIRKQIYGNLTPWQRVQIARHPERPYTLDYINLIMDDFIELHGDRRYGDDKAIVTGFATIDGVKVAVAGHQKGRDTKENIYRNFGCSHPEGYRKAIRLAELAERFRLPFVSFIDTPGAYPGVAAEERGQAEAIAYNLREMFTLTVPVVGIVIGEGGSGGALGIGVVNRLMILENAYYSVISPEGCAAILWKDRTMTERAAETLKLAAKDLKGLGVVDEIISEPLGGAHNDRELTADTIKKGILRQLKELSKLKPEELKIDRYQRFRKFGIVSESV